MQIFFGDIYLSVSYKTGTGQTSRFSSTKPAFVTVCGKKENQNISFASKYWTSTTQTEDSVFLFIKLSVMNCEV